MNPKLPLHWLFVKSSEFPVPACSCQYKYFKYIPKTFQPGSGFIEKMRLLVPVRDLLVFQPDSCGQVSFISSSRPVVPTGPFHIPGHYFPHTPSPQLSSTPLGSFSRVCLISGTICSCPFHCLVYWYSHIILPLLVAKKAARKPHVDKTNNPRRALFTCMLQFTSTKGAVGQ